MEPVSTSWAQFFAPGTPVVALPDWEKPRLLLPASAERLWEKTAFYPAFRRTARLYRAYLRTRASLGLLRTRIADSPSSLLPPFLAEVVPAVKTVVMLAGAQKAILQLWDAQGRVAGYLKFARSRIARRRLAAEHRLLHSVPGGQAPRALKWGPLGDGDGLLVEPVSGHTLPAYLPVPPDADRLQGALAVSEPVPIGAHPFVADLTGQAFFELGFLLERLGGRRWPVVARHGDYAPWNILATSQGRLSAIDWEYGSPAGFPGLDIAYYILRVGSLIYRWTPARAAAYAASHLEKRAGLRPYEAAVLVRLAAWLAYRDSVEDADARDAPLRGWLVAVWEKEI
jgi:hypothetical protein